MTITSRWRTVFASAFKFGAAFTRAARNTLGCEVPAGTCVGSCRRNQPPSCSGVPSSRTPTAPARMLRHTARNMKSPALQPKGWHRSGRHRPKPIQHSPCPCRKRLPGHLQPVRRGKSLQCPTPLRHPSLSLAPLRSRRTCLHCQLRPSPGG